MSHHSPFTLPEAKTHRGKRYIESLAPKVEESRKKVLMIHGNKVSQALKDFMVELRCVIGPAAIPFKKSNSVFPFEDPKPFEFFSFKNATPLFVLASHQKKRPHHLTFGRLFNHQLVDLFEFEVSGREMMNTRAASRIGGGHRPMLVFHGRLWDALPPFQRLRTILCDIFGGKAVPLCSVTGLDSVAVFSLAGPKDSAESASVSAAAITGADLTPFTLSMGIFSVPPRNLPTAALPAEMPEGAIPCPIGPLVPVGPMATLKFKRCKLGPDTVWRAALRQPKELAASRTAEGAAGHGKETEVKRKKKGNLQRDELGHLRGQLHIGKQDTRRGLATRTYKGTKDARKAARESAAEVATAPGPVKRPRGGDGTVGGATFGGSGVLTTDSAQRPARKRTRRSGGIVHGVQAEYAM